MMKGRALRAAAVLSVVGLTAIAGMGLAAADETTVDEPGSSEFVVPTNVCRVTVDAYGAQGGSSEEEEDVGEGVGGLGGRQSGTFAVTPGERLGLNVGGQGETGSFSTFPPSSPSSSRQAVKVASTAAATAAPGSSSARVARAVAARPTCGRRQAAAGACRSARFRRRPRPRARRPMSVSSRPAVAVARAARARNSSSSKVTMAAPVAAPPVAHPTATVPTTRSSARPSPGTGGEAADGTTPGEGGDPGIFSDGGEDGNTDGTGEGGDGGDSLFRGGGGGGGGLAGGGGGGGATGGGAGSSGVASNVTDASAEAGVQEGDGEITLTYFADAPVPCVVVVSSIRFTG